MLTQVPTNYCNVCEMFCKCQVFMNLWPCSVYVKIRLELPELSIELAMVHASLSHKKKNHV